MRFEPDCRFLKDPQGIYAVVNASRAVAGSSGPVVSIHKTEAAADRAAKKDHRFKTMRLNKNLNVNDHVNPMTDAVIGKVAKMETPRIDPGKRRFMPTVRPGGR
jgi:hypothetical protein